MRCDRVHRDQFHDHCNLMLFFSGAPVRFCLSNGYTWQFFLFVKSDEGKRVYQSDIMLRAGERHGSVVPKKKLRDLVSLIYHWVSVFRIPFI